MKKHKVGEMFKSRTFIGDIDEWMQIVKVLDDGQYLVARTAAFYDYAIVTDGCLDNWMSPREGKEPVKLDVGDGLQCQVDLAEPNTDGDDKWVKSFNNKY